MKIIEITVSAGRTFNHPYESFSNFRPEVSFKATLDEGINVENATKELQRRAESHVEEIKTKILAKLKAESEMKQKVYQLERELACLQEEIPF
jgi:glycerol-3-phosphate O-acyltransferase